MNLRKFRYLRYQMLVPKLLKIFFEFYKLPPEIRKQNSGLEYFRFKYRVLRVFYSVIPPCHIGPYLLFVSPFPISSSPFPGANGSPLCPSSNCAPVIMPPIWSCLHHHATYAIASSLFPLLLPRPHIHSA